MTTTIATPSNSPIDGAAETVRSVAGSVAARVPEAASTTRDVLVEADRRLRTGSDQMLAIGAALSFGLAMGLLLGGAGRLLVAAALAPAAAMGLRLIDRETAGIRGPRVDHPLNQLQYR